VSRSRFSRARNADVRGRIEVVISWRIAEVEVVVEGGPERVLMMESFGDEPLDPGRRETK
jgi:hypothetical protein